MPPTHETVEELRDWLSRELHVLVLVISNAWGGLEQTSLNDVRLLVQNGLRVTMLIREGSPIDHVIKDESPQIRVLYAPAKVRNYFDAELFRKIRYLIDKEGVNLVHSHQTSILGSVVPPLLRRPHVALVVSRHILNSHNKRDPVHALIYRRVDYVLVLSRMMRRNLATTFPIAEKKLRIVNLAIDLDRFNPNLIDRTEARSRLGRSKDDFLVGIVGRLDPMKGQDLLVKAVARLKKSIPNIFGVMVGSETPGLNGSYLAELETSIRQLHLEDSIQIFPSTKEVPEVMAALDIFVMPSWSEAFGLVALEAMAMGVPAILSVGGSAEEIARASGAELMRPKDAYDLARKLLFLHHSPEVRAEMAVNGREYVIAHHSKILRLKKTLELYARCYRRRIFEDSSRKQPASVQE